MKMKENKIIIEKFICPRHSKKERAQAQKLEPSDWCVVVLFSDCSYEIEKRLPTETEIQEVISNFL
jgi:hypothetical protein